MRVDVVMLYGWKKAREKKAPGTGLRPLRIPLFQRVSESVFFARFSSSFWPAPVSQFEELLLEDPEVDAIAAPAGLLVETDLRM